MAQASKKGLKTMMPGGNATPQIRLDSTQFPAIKDWKVGQTYKVEIELKAKGKQEGQQYSFDTANKGMTSMNFDITSIKADDGDATTETY